MNNGFADLRDLRGGLLLQLLAQLLHLLARVVLSEALLVAAGARLLPGAGLSLRQADVLAVGGLIPLGAAVYAAGLWLLRVEGREEFTRAFQRWRAGRK